MCMKTPKMVSAPIPKAAPAPEAAPDEIKNSESSNANEQAKKKKGKKQFRKNAAGLQIGSVASGSPAKPNVGG
jgi:hypothetical protein